MSCVKLHISGRSDDNFLVRYSQSPFGHDLDDTKRRRPSALLGPWREQSWSLSSCPRGDPVMKPPLRAYRQRQQ